jgi:hypothetical protein
VSGGDGDVSVGTFGGAGKPDFDLVRHRLDATEAMGGLFRSQQLM